MSSPQGAPKPVRIVFVCIGNSCRSPMAEALARHLAPELIEASSVGLFPAPVIQPETIQVLAERGVTLEPRDPQSLVLMDANGADLLVNMSGAPLEHMLASFHGRHISWNVRDPIGQPISVYRTVRDQIEKKVVELIGQVRNGSLAL